MAEMGILGVLEGLVSSAGFYKLKALIITTYKYKFSLAKKNHELQ